MVTIDTDLSVIALLLGVNSTLTPGGSVQEYKYRDVTLRLKNHTIHVGVLREGIAHVGRAWNLSYEQTALLLASLYVWSGYDYTSAFYGLPKARWLDVLLQKETRRFVIGGDEPQIHSITNGEVYVKEDVFRRLVGCLYMKLHSKEFHDQKGLCIRPDEFDERKLSSSTITVNEHLSDLTAQVRRYLLYYTII